MGRQSTLRIGLSARLFHPKEGASGIETKTLQVLEQSVAQWIMSRDVLVFMIPSILKDGPMHRSNIRLRDYAILNSWTCVSLWRGPIKLRMLSPPTTGGG